jgi:hypothetical protein
MTTAPANYLIHPDPSRLSVEAWTKWALPFDKHTPVQLQYRNELRTALMGLRAENLLHATHTSQHARRGPDVENLLFYNVRAAAFRHLAKDALRFERRNAPPPAAPEPLDFEARHHVRYEVRTTRELPFHYTTADACVASARTVCTEAKQVKDLAGLWRSFKSAMVGNAGATGLERNSFSIQLTISAPLRYRFNLTSIVKPLTDAFISALHCYRGEQLDEVVRRVSLCLTCAPDTIRELLLDTRSALLGPRAVPHLRDKGVQWSPADDGLIACEILRETSPADSAIEVRGCLFSAPPL